MGARARPRSSRRASVALPALRCSTQTEVSTTITAARNVGKRRIAAAEARQPARALALDQRRERLAHKCCLLLRAGEPLCLGEQIIVEGECRPHRRLPSVAPTSASNDGDVPLPHTCGTTSRRGSGKVGVWPAYPSALRSRPWLMPRRSWRAGPFSMASASSGERRRQSSWETWCATTTSSALSPSATRVLRAIPQPECARDSPRLAVRHATGSNETASLAPPRSAPLDRLTAQLLAAPLGGGTNERRRRTRAVPAATSIVPSATSASSPWTL
jgi:hypothetical protein